MAEQKYGEVLTLKQTCEMLHISRTHLYQIIKAKQLKYYDIGIRNGKKHIYRFMKVDILKYLKKNQMENLDEYKSTEGEDE